ncbi:hypothetical protein E8E12_011267 [Didymella heteroderae]|uniref:Major facilitator superfamily (MFS) profile domain-containing protein n=1 Tax=Didymella heteroderae TaxID=1769908 RepID=A0A9P4WYY5_9PLEO|nr:hypothetical protein E8E12_011267 [Didymella heteroderae]
MSEKFHSSVERRASDSTAESETSLIKEEREGDVAAWLTVVGSVLVYYCSMGILNSFGFFNNYYSSTFLPDTSTGFTSVQVPVFLVQGLLVGFAAAFGAQPALTVVGQHFKQQRAIAMGLVTAGSALGGIGFPLMFERLLPVLEFPWMLRVAALKVAVLYSIALAISTSRPAGKDQPRNCGSLIDFRGFLDLRYAVLCIEMYTNAAYSSPSISEYFLPMMNGCSILGAVLGGLLGDQIGRLNLLWPVVMFTGCICIFVWLLINSLAVTVLFTCLYGFGTGTFTALLPSVVGQITPDENLGARVGAFYSVVAVASLVGTPIGSALITEDTSRQGYWWLIIFSGTAIIIGSLFMLGSRFLHDRSLYKKW